MCAQVRTLHSGGGFWVSVDDSKQAEPAVLEGDLVLPSLVKLELWLMTGRGNVHAQDLTFLFVDAFCEILCTFPLMQPAAQRKLGRKEFDKRSL